MDGTFGEWISSEAELIYTLHLPAHTIRNSKNDNEDDLRRNIYTYLKYVKIKASALTKPKARAAMPPQVSYAGSGRAPRHEANGARKLIPVQRQPLS
ncbi:MAG: hypothetical protein ACR2PG_21780 [Hyphomicrobiaceae bacterium]